MPGRGRLIAELGVSGKTVELALKRLEELGLLAAAEVGKRRRILVKPKSGKRLLRVAIMTYESTDRGLSYLVDLQHSLTKAGHIAEFASDTVVGLSRSRKRISAFVKRNKADAWVLIGTPLKVLQWFESQNIPAFALFGRRRSVNLPGGGPDKIPAMRQVVGRLCELGHHRIALLCREERRKPFPGAMEQVFLDEMNAHGIVTGAFNLPDWDDTASGFRECLDSLYGLTPPTALIIDEAFLFLVARQYLARRGIIAPQHVSLVCCDPDPWFDWYWPSAAYIQWDAQPLVRRIVRWVGNLAKGKYERGQTDVRATFIEGGTIGMAP